LRRVRRREELNCLRKTALKTLVSTAPLAAEDTCVRREERQRTEKEKEKDGGKRRGEDRGRRRRASLQGLQAKQSHSVLGVLDAHILVSTYLEARRKWMGRLVDDDGLPDWPMVDGQLGR
jgi:hypothetical protein